MNDFKVSAACEARVQRPERRRIGWRAASLDQLIAADHRVRVVWAYVDALDLSALHQRIRAVEGRPGRDAVDPRIPMALWMFATIEGVGSARRLARLCERDPAYLWICGGVGVNHHLLSGFRTAHGEALDQLLTDTVATLMHQGLVTLNVVAQDGMRVRAHAGGGSFRRRKTLERCRDEAREQVRTSREQRETEADDESGDPRRRAAQTRAARERRERVEQALAELEQLQHQKERRKKGSGKDARSSTTDPQARVMKMGDGGYRPAYNVQFASDGETRVIVSVDVTNSGGDRGRMAAMHADVRERYAATPAHYVVDGGFATKEDVAAVEQRGSRVPAPAHGADRMRERGVDPHARQRGDSDEMSAFRQRMATDEARALYKRRPSIAEFPNADCRNRGPHQFRVRGPEKVRAVSLRHAITFNFLRMLALGCLA